MASQTSRRRRRRPADGKPDLSGVWVTRPGYTGNIAKDLKPGEVSFQPWAAALYKHRGETESREDPQAYCVLSGVPREHVVPYPFKILNSKGEIVILYEALHSYRQIFMDGRALPKDPNPHGWDIRRALGRRHAGRPVVGFVDNNWLDNSGHPGTESLRLTEKFRRRDFGHIDLELMIDDPKAYTKPWTVNLQFTAS